MLNLAQLIKQFDMHITGIVHAGAHYGEEFTDYCANGVEHVVFIEPHDATFRILQQQVGQNENVLLFHCAVGAEDAWLPMWEETVNTGQSNSFLKPKLHLEQHPSITFRKSGWLRKVRKLDYLDFDRARYNMLCMDIQGYELEALKGAVDTLEHINYVYLEVNRAEVYEGNALVEQIDAFLHDFQRVAENWGGGTWGDALWIRKGK